MVNTEPAPFLDPDFATQSTLRNTFQDPGVTAGCAGAAPRHVAIIMDGNRRWARQRGLPVSRGHAAGADNAVHVLEAAAALDVEVVTLFVFAAANWRRSPVEVKNLWRLAERRFARLARRCLRHDVRVELIGRRDRLPDGLLQAAQKLCARTAGGRRRLRIAMDYSAQWSIWQAARQVGGHVSRAEFETALCGDTPAVDLLIRTGNEQRLSDFLLWECAFAELYFSPLYWPDFDGEALAAALRWFARRRRRFGN